MGSVRRVRVRATARPVLAIAGARLRRRCGPASGPRSPPHGLLAPYFGASTLIWANTIATVLVALSVGYALGGRLADRRADLRGLCAIVLMRVAAARDRPVRAGPVPPGCGQRAGRRSRSAGSLGSLAAVLVLVAVPVLLLGMVAPYADRLAVRRVSDTGRSSAGLYAISTVGSLVGTFLAALLLIPTIGTHRTFLVFALCSRPLAAIGDRRRWRFWWSPVLVARCSRSRHRDRRRRDRRPRDLSTETQYQYARVLQFRDGVRWLEFNEGVAVHSVYRPGTYLTDGYWDNFLVLPFAASGRRGTAPADRDPRRRRRLARPLLRPLLPAHARRRGRDRRRADPVGKRYFGLGGPVCTSTPPTHGRGWRRARPATTRSSSTPTASRTSRSTWSRASSSSSPARTCTPAGSLIVNVGHLPGSDRARAGRHRDVADGLFPYVDRGISSTHQLAAWSRCTQPVLSATTMVDATPGPPARPGARRGGVAGHFGPPLGGGAVYTDDKAPVEWLTDLSILHYATGSDDPGARDPRGRHRARRPLGARRPAGDRPVSGRAHPGGGVRRPGHRAGEATRGRRSPPASQTPMRSLGPCAPRACRRIGRWSCTTPATRSPQPGRGGCFGTSVTRMCVFWMGVSVAG